MNELVKANLRKEQSTVPVHIKRLVIKRLQTKETSAVGAQHRLQGDGVQSGSFITWGSAKTGKDLGDVVGSNRGPNYLDRRGRCGHIVGSIVPICVVELQEASHKDVRLPSKSGRKFELLSAGHMSSIDA